MSGKLFAYSFTHHLVMVQGREMENFGEGDEVVSATYREDRINGTVGADGNMQSSISADQSADIKLTFLMTAPENDYLEGLYQQYVDGVITGISVSILNSVTGKGEVATTGFIPKLADMSKGTKAKDREWTITVPKLSIQKGTK